jgi:transcriptional regulator with XRE-family HTH domain
MDDKKRFGIVGTNNDFDGLNYDLDGIGRRIRQVRVAHGLSQCDFADALHISRKWLSELENGKKCPSGLFLLGMECRFAISADWLLDASGSMLVCSEGEEKCAEAVIFLKSFNKLSKKGREKLLNIMNAFLFIEENNETPQEFDS